MVELRVVCMEGMMLIGMFEKDDKGEVLSTLSNPLALMFVPPQGIMLNLVPGAPKKPIVLPPNTVSWPVDDQKLRDAYQEKTSIVKVHKRIPPGAN